RAIIEEVAATFDMLPRREREPLPELDSARIFNSQARAELWAAGNGDSRTDAGAANYGHSAPVNGNGNGNGYATHPEPALNASATDNSFSLVSPAPESETRFSHYSRRTDPISRDEPGSAYSRFGF